MKALQVGRDVKHAQLTWFEELSIALMFWLAVLLTGVRNITRRAS